MYVHTMAEIYEIVRYFQRYRTENKYSDTADVASQQIIIGGASSLVPFPLHSNPSSLLQMPDMGGVSM